MWENRTAGQAVKRCLYTAEPGFQSYVMFYEIRGGWIVTGARFASSSVCFPLPIIPPVPHASQLQPTVMSGIPDQAASSVVSGRECGWLQRKWVIDHLYCYRSPIIVDTELTKYHFVVLSQ